MKATRTSDFVRVFLLQKCATIIIENQKHLLKGNIVRQRDETGLGFAIFFAAFLSILFFVLSIATYPSSDSGSTSTPTADENL